MVKKDFKEGLHYRRPQWSRKSYITLVDGKLWRSWTDKPSVYIAGDYTDYYVCDEQGKKIPDLDYVDFELWVDGMIEGYEGKQSRNSSGFFTYRGIECGDQLFDWHFNGTFVESVTYSWLLKNHGDGDCRRWLGKLVDTPKEELINGKTLKEWDRLWVKGTPIYVWVGSDTSSTRSSGLRPSDWSEVSYISLNREKDTTKESHAVTTKKEPTMAIEQVREKEVKVEVIVNGKAIGGTKTKKVKTMLEKKPKYIGEWYDHKGDYLETASFQKKKDATRLLQEPQNLGKTLVLYEAKRVLKTSIPVSETDIS